MERNLAATPACQAGQEKRREKKEANRKKRTQYLALAVEIHKLASARWPDQDAGHGQSSRQIKAPNQRVGEGICWSPFLRPRACRTAGPKAAWDDEAREFESLMSLSCTERDNAANQLRPIQPIRRKTRQKRSSKLNPHEARGARGARGFHGEASRFDISPGHDQTLALKRLKLVVRLPRVMPVRSSQNMRWVQVSFPCSRYHGALTADSCQSGSDPVQQIGSAGIQTGRSLPIWAG